MACIGQILLRLKITLDVIIWHGFWVFQTRLYVQIQCWSNVHFSCPHLRSAQQIIRGTDKKPMCPASKRLPDLPKPFWKLILMQSSKATATSHILNPLQFWTGNTSDKCSHTKKRTSLLDSFKHILISITSFESVSSSLKTLPYTPHVYK